MKKRVEGQPHIVKDMDSGIIQNTSDNERRRYQLQKQNALAAMRTQEEVKHLKSEIAEIKDLLKQLAQK